MATSSSGSKQQSAANPVHQLLLGGPRRVKNRRRNPIWRFRRFLLLAVLFGLGLLLGGFALLAREELPDDDFAQLAQTSYVCTADVETDCDVDVAAMALSAGEDRVIVPYSAIPQVTIDAVVAVEDKNYFNDQIGIDPVGIGRALYQNTREGRAAQGGSTITQQYVKNAFDIDADRNIVTKLKEAALAVKLNRRWSREEILGRYLNRIYFGRGAYGIQAAAQAYYGKNVEELGLGESAFLAGLIRAPSSAEPFRDPDEANRRRDVSLTRMVTDGYISQVEADEVMATPVIETVIAPTNRDGLGPVLGQEDGSEYFMEAVRQQLVELEPEIGEVFSSGLRVYTTLDPQMQEAAFLSVTEVVDPRFDGDLPPSGSLVAIDERGRVVAMMGGYDFEASQVNLAMGVDGGGSGRQPGSSFKTFALAEALEQGFSANSLYAAPFTIEIPEANDGQTWTVGGGGSEEGYRDLVDGLRVSSNVVYAQLMVDLSPGTVVQMANNLGVSAELPEVNALVLGSGEVSVLDMAASYSTISNQGIRYEPILIERIEDRNGEVICWYPVDGVCQQSEGREGEPVLDASIARQVTFALEQVVVAGTGRNAQFGQPAAGKTGTTQDARDAWFVGFTCELSTAVWMGYPGFDPNEPLTMENFRGIEVHGGDFPAEIWGAFNARAADIRSGRGEAPCTELATQADFPGLILNTELSTTTLPFCSPTPAAPGEGEGDAAETAETTAPPTTAEGDNGGIGAVTTEPCVEPPPVPLDENGQPIPTTPDGAPVPTDESGSTTAPASTAEGETATTAPTTAAESTTEQPTTTAAPNGDGDGDDDG